MKQLQRPEDVKALAVLDMDGTLLESRTVDVLCQKLGLKSELREINTADFQEEYRVSEAIAQLFTEMKASDLERIFDSIRVVKGAKEFVDFLSQKRFLTAIVTDSYTFLASRLAERLGIHSVWGNELGMVDGIITGKIRMPLGWEKQERCRRKAVCKLHVLYRLVEEHKIGMDQTLAIGDSRGDSCMIEKAALGVAFRPKDPEIVEVADLVVDGDFLELKKKLKPFLKTSLVD